ncbi:MAG: agmatine deiminase [Lachnospiraceae bacterium]
MENPGMQEYAPAVTGRTPAQDGFFMPAEYAPQERIWMIWPWRRDNWRSGAVPAQQAFLDAACAIASWEPVTLLVPARSLAKADRMLAARREKAAENITLLTMESDDAWARDTGPTFLVHPEKKELRAVDWTFNAWGGTWDGLYEDWEADDRLAGEICRHLGIVRYRAAGFVMEGGAFHTDGAGTVLTTSMCLLSPGRNPSMTREEIEKTLLSYLGARKLVWLPMGIDPQETDGHVDDVACFTAPGEAACIWTENPEDPCFAAARSAYETLCASTDATGRPLTVHRICCPREPVRIGNFSYVTNAHAVPRRPGDLCPASYLNFLVVNGAVLVPQFGDPNDSRALAEIQALFPDRQAVGVASREILYGGGNLHCITQQQPKI